MTYETLDTDLVNALLNNGRSSLRNLAGELDVSVTTVSNHLSDLEEAGAIDGYTPILNYDALGYDVTAVIQLKVKGTALPTVTDELQQYEQMVSVYEVTGDHDIIAVAKFTDTDQMNDQIKTLLTDPNINESNTSVVLNSVAEGKQFEVESKEQ
ncbi:HTH-type transcriptional regulator Lrp [Natronoglomus mannanivorans]|uniref:Lrp/AsnC family transcriptional regulator n=1 Tax=Natronoglomus mannanivorans TaxID=2979990 RepID=A0AAP2Z418_9EURY|nr:Lrp/AsnC family transcriptional regulator [Halobacteria archaeon AArc-xg1-1]